MVLRSERYCDWKADDEGVWSTECGQEFVFIDSGPKENGMSFCCYCGKGLHPVPYEAPVDEEQA